MVFFELLYNRISYTCEAISYTTTLEDQQVPWTIVKSGLVMVTNLKESSTLEGNLCIEELDCMAPPPKCSNGEAQNGPR